MSEWQPIDTPPEDEGAVQVYVPGIKCTFMAYYCDGEFTASWNPTPEMMNQISQWKKPDAPTNPPLVDELRRLRDEMAVHIGPDPDSTIGWADELDALIERMTG